MKVPYFFPEKDKLSLDTNNVFQVDASMSGCNLSIGGIKVLFFCVATCLDSMVDQLWCCPTRSGVVSILFTPRLVFQHTEQPKPVMLSDWQHEWEPEAKRKTLYTKVDQKKFVFDFATDEKRFFSTTYITLQQPNARWKP